MKKTIILLSVIAATLRAEDSPWWRSWIGFAQQVSDGHSLTVALYPGWSPNLEVEGRHEPWGFGAAALYRVNTHAFVGMRLDWLADSFWSPSAAVNLEADVQLFPGSLNLNLTPFALSGVAVPIAGVGDKNGAPSAIVGGGIYATIWRPTENASLQVFYAYERWVGLNADVHRPGAAFTFRF